MKLRAERPDIAGAARGQKVVPIIDNLHQDLVIEHMQAAVHRAFHRHDTCFRRGVAVEYLAPENVLDDFSGVVVMTFSGSEQKAGLMNGNPVRLRF